ncbi:MAG: ATP-binding protein [Sedimenticola sp.]
MAMENNGSAEGSLRGNNEFQSSILRLVAWGIMVGFIGLGGDSGFFPFSWEEFSLYFGAHFIWFTALFVHIIWKPRPIKYRQYLGALSDVSGTSFCIYLSGDPVSPFFLIYLWSFISQGTRFGISNLLFACLASLVGYITVVYLMDGWQVHAFYVNFLILGLIVLPLYQVMLLRKLHESRKAAEAANRARGDFLAAMTHELRTPLSGVLGLSRLLGTTQLDREQREYVDSITSAGNVLEALVGDVLDFSKIDAEKLELNPKLFDLRHCVVGTCRGLSTAATDKGVELVCTFSQDVPNKVKQDELRLRQVLYNLIGNAIKFTTSGHVIVKVEVARMPGIESRVLQITVQDTGIGIPDEKQRQVFESFWQVDTTRTRQFGGTGLGTSIARDLTELMGGKIGFKSEEGKGSSFWIRLPLPDDVYLQAPTPPLRLAGRSVAISEPHELSRMAMIEACTQAGMEVTVLDDDGLEAAGRGDPLNDNPVDLLLVSDSLERDDLAARVEKMRGLAGDGAELIHVGYPSRAVQVGESAVIVSKPFNPQDLWQCMRMVVSLDGQSTTERVPPSGSLLSEVDGQLRCRILVAEDDNINALLIRTLLTKAGHDVTHVIDGQAALEAAQAREFDLALIDVRMPNMDGIEFTRRLREQEQGRRLPIIALTANATRDMEVECLDAGMDEFLVKPVDADRLDSLLLHYAGQK